MPGLDSTGPMGQGAQTGRKMGNCGGSTPNEEMAPGRRFFRSAGRGLRRRNSAVNNESPIRGRGRGRGLGRGMGRTQA